MELANGITVQSSRMRPKSVEVGPERIYELYFRLSLYKNSSTALNKYVATQLTLYSSTGRSSSLPIIMCAIPYIDAYQHSYEAINGKFKLNNLGDVNRVEFCITNKVGTIIHVSNEESVIFIRGMQI